MTQTIPNMPNKYLRTVGQSQVIEIPGDDLKNYLLNKYSRTYVDTLLCYIHKYHSLITGDLSIIETLKPGTASNVIKSLIVLSKFLGCYKYFKDRVRDYGLKIQRPDSFQSFLRILKASDSNILEWFKETKTILKTNEQLFLKYCLITGLRKEESIKSFNKIIELSKSNRLNEYYDQNLSCLMHFKYDKDFLRRTKNCFISIVPESLINGIVNSDPVSYNAIFKRLFRHSSKSRINELRDYFNTYMLKHGILEQEVNLLCGRIPPSIFVRHYWSPNLKELSTKVLDIQNQLLSDIEKL